MCPRSGAVKSEGGEFVKSAERDWRRVAGKLGEEEKVGG